MVKAIVSGDCFRDGADVYVPVGASVEGDCDYDDPVSPWVLGPDDPVDPDAPGPTLEVWLRRKSGYTDDGAPMFEWVWMASSRAIVYEERKEYDATAGHTVVEVRAVMVLLRSAEVPGGFDLHETMAVQNKAVGEWFNVSSYHHVDDRLEVVMGRVDEGSG